MKTANAEAKAHFLAFKRAERRVEPDRTQAVSEQQVVSLLVRDEMSQVPETIEREHILRPAFAADVSDENLRIDIGTPQRPGARNGCVDVFELDESEVFGWRLADRRS